LQSALVSGLNAVVQGSSIYASQRFANVTLGADTLSLLAQDPTGTSLARLNHLLIEDTYPQILRSRSVSIYTANTSSILSVGGGGTISITGYNDVDINSGIGPGSTSLASLQVTSSHASVFIEKQSARVATSSALKISGVTVDVAGVVSNTVATPGTTEV